MMADPIPPLRYFIPTGDTRDQMREEARNHPLYRDGDMLLVWANEGDLYNHSGLFAAAKMTIMPTEAQVASACMSYRHDFGLMDAAQRQSLMFVAREWLHAWRKEFAALAPQPAPALADSARRNAAQLLWDMLQMQNGAHDGMTREEVQGLCDAVKAESGFGAVEAFLAALRGEVGNG